MTPAALHSRLCLALFRAVKARFDGRVSDWCAAGNVSFNEPDKRGEFSFYGRNYLREPLDFYGNQALTDLVLCFGTQTGKTTIMFAGGLFRLVDKARRSLWVHPASHGPAGAESIAKTRWIPTLKASPASRGEIPTGGSSRFDITRSQQILKNGSIADWVGSNSVGQLASNSIEDVYQDEIDKFNVTRRRDSEGEEVEADACELADERTTRFDFPKRVKGSTPTLPQGRIWTRLLQTDLRRRFIPCPLCGRDHPSSRLCVIAWNTQFTVLPTKWGYATPYEPNSAMPMSFVEWDKEAKRTDGTWDLERVEKSAGYRCPHCGGRFRDEQKIWMDENGVWIPTQRGLPRTAGHHLPSWYSYNEQTTAGKLALGFLGAVDSVQGPRNFVNSKCAEVYQSQEFSAERVELVRQTQIEITTEWKKLLTADAQQKWPYIWFVLRAWKGGNSEGILCGHLDSFEELRAIQIEHGIPDAGVVVDSGFGSKREAEVYRHCATYGVVYPRRSGFPLHVGWMPSKGFPTRKRWRDPKSKLWMPYFLRAIDPFMGTTEAGKIEMSLFEFAGMYYEDLLAALRTGKGGYTWAVSKDMDEYTAEDGSSFWKHIDGHVKRFVQNKRTGQVTEEYQKRHRDWPDHLLDCEILQVALANFNEFFSVEKPNHDDKAPTQP